MEINVSIQKGWKQFWSQWSNTLEREGRGNTVKHLSLGANFRFPIFPTRDYSYRRQIIIDNLVMSVDEIDPSIPFILNFSTPNVERQTRPQQNLNSYSGNIFKSDHIESDRVILVLLFMDWYPVLYWLYVFYRNERISSGSILLLGVHITTSC